MVKENLQNVIDDMKIACEKSGININDVTLIAVSKTKPNELIMEAYESGVRDFGENKVQELLRKKEELPKDIRWHMIGHLQTNKVRQLLGNTVLIHSIDSIRLADTIDTEARKKAFMLTDYLKLILQKRPQNTVSWKKNLMRYYRYLQDIRTYISKD